MNHKSGYDDIKKAGLIIIFMMAVWLFPVERNAGAITFAEYDLGCVERLSEELINAYSALQYPLYEDRPKHFDEKKFDPAIISEFAFKNFISDIRACINRHNMTNPSPGWPETKFDYIASTGVTSETALIEDICAKFVDRELRGTSYCKKMFVKKINGIYYCYYTWEGKIDFKSYEDFEKEVERAGKMHFFYLIISVGNKTILWCRCS